MSRYYEVYAGWKNDPEGFWAKAATDIDWVKPWDKVFDPYADQYGRWFAGAECNTCYNCVDRHVKNGHGEDRALIYDSPITGKQSFLNFNELLAEVEAFGAVLQDRGVGKGDRVIIYMPMIAETAIAMLACARIGAVHSVVFGGFAANELATRIIDAEPKAVLSASCGIEPNRVIPYKPLLDEAIELSSHKPDVSIVFQREEVTAELHARRDFDWASEVAAAKSAGKKAPCVTVGATDPLYILYTSGTTGEPKGVVRDNGGHMVALYWSMKNVYDIDPGEVFWAASDMGWQVGHSYIVYGTLLNRSPAIVFEGKPVGTPDAGTFWRMISEHNIKALLTAPTAFRAIKKEDPEGLLIKDYNLSKMNTLFLAGERADPDTIQWAETKLGVPVVDHWWQTESGWPMVANPVGLGMLPVKYGSPTVPMPGYEIDILDEANNKLPAGETGAISVKMPLPPGCLPTLWNDHERFRSSYLTEFPGYYETSDAGYLDEDGYLYVMARTDDIINVAGHRLSTGGMEEAVLSHPDVAECAVIGVADAMKGQIPAGFIVINSGVTRDLSEIEGEVVKVVREKIGPVAAFKVVITVDRLPKTRSGKILRGTMRNIADGQDYKMPATIDDPAILDEITEALKSRGIPG